MKFFKIIIIYLVCFFNSMCSQTREATPKTHNNITTDSIYSKLSTINYASYKGQTIGYLLDNESINYNRFNFIDSEYRCLDFVNFSFGHDVFLEIYCPQNPQFIKMCDASFPTSWNLEDFKKEKITEIILVRKFPLLKKVTVFPRQ